MSIRRLLEPKAIGHWSTIERKAATKIFSFSPSAFFTVPICVQLQCLYRKQALQGQSVHLTKDRIRATGAAAHGTDLTQFRPTPSHPWAKLCKTENDYLKSCAVILKSYGSFNFKVLSLHEMFCTPEFRNNIVQSCCICCNSMLFGGITSRFCYQGSTNIFLCLEWQSVNVCLNRRRTHVSVWFETSFLVQTYFSNFTNSISQRDG